MRYALSAPVLRGSGILHATLIAPGLDATCIAYGEQLGLEVAARGMLESDLATVRFGRGLADRYPAAVVPLPGQTMVEIDEVQLPRDSADSDGMAAARWTNSDRSRRFAGQHSIALHLPALPDDLDSAGWNQIADVRFGDERHVGLAGPTGEHVQLVLRR